MPNPSNRQQRAGLTELLAESRELEDMARVLQNSDDGSDQTQVARTLNDLYMRWYGRGLALLPEDLKTRFRNDYEGSTLSPRIRAFLGAPRAESIFKVDRSTEPSLRISPWQYPFDRCFFLPIGSQRQILHEAEQRLDIARDVDTLVELENYLRSLNEFFYILGERSRGRQPFEVHDEYDVQDVLHALLRLRYRDVRPEEWTPSYAGRSSRTDFLLKDERVMVEAKMTRDGLGEKKVIDELSIDIVQYKAHADCDAVFALVYDPSRRIRNRNGVEADLTGDQHGIPVRVVIVQ